MYFESTCTTVCEQLIAVVVDVTIRKREHLQFTSMIQTLNPGISLVTCQLLNAHAMWVLWTPMNYLWRWNSYCCQVKIASLYFF